MKRGYWKTYIKTFIVILILVAIGCGIGYFFKNEYDVEQWETIKTDMLLIEAKTKIIAQKVKMKEKDITYVGRKVAEAKEEELVKNLLEKNIIELDEKKNMYYILEKEDLEKLELASINLEEGYYIVEYNSNEIIYTKGIQDKNGNIIYKLSEIENIDKTEK